LLVGAGGGLYWFVPAVVLGFAGAVLNVWVLLIEILR
jgi:modulator of FtsH protease